MIKPPGAPLIAARAVAVLLVAAVSLPTPANAQQNGAGMASVSQGGIVVPPRAEANDNRLAGGVLRDGVLTLQLVAQMARWYPEAEDGPFKVVETFGEAGRTPQVPGPLIRVPVGTKVDATITNLLPDTIIVLGLGGRSDSLRVAPTQTRRTSATLSAVGTFLYRAGIVRDGKLVFKGTQGQLVGGLIVHTGPPPADRILITTGWDPTPYFLAMNGKSWPYTEKFVFTVGDTVRWRVLNSSTGTGGSHPMHLHGFYYRVDARGGWDADTLYRPGQERWVVTENLGSLSSMAMTWVPTRAGNWLFHCHNSDHVAGRHRHIIAGRPRPYPEPSTHDAQEHMAWDMSGLVNAITILPRAGDPAPDLGAKAGARKLRLLMQERAGYYGRGPGYGYVLQEGVAEPAADSINIPGPKLVLRRGEPVEITLVNRMSAHTAVHWHGIELESYYDGISGWSGMGDNLAPMIAPRDSFIVRFTPPRAGTFIYHAHITDYVQIARGLYGALLVVPPDQPPVPGADHVAIVGFGRPKGRPTILVNGSTAPTPIERRRDVPQRLRLINISTENSVIVTLSDAGTPVTWRAVAKDGFDLAAAQQRIGPAEMRISPGETYDFEFESAADVLRLRVRNPNVEDGNDDISLELRVTP